MNAIQDIVLAAGVALQLLAVLGLTVMRNAYDRLHYVGVAAFGALLVGVSIVCRESFSLIGDKALVTGAWLVLAGPVVIHTTVRSLRTRALGDWRAGDEEIRSETGP